ncbi:3-isopropylmalate dehydratase large subunit [Altererythrobacter marinus]|uniref:3-isopropylmalate dehydratase n=1 Tax=Pelagerythrobacter marinus TaxID=538382 RepID=A0ABW9UXA6_9SPHN|nr:3-isopropylmalate dehydratase large subunit [Pelagerythrobacter marinus]MXO69454.1 3-isopropylmalate dehydratase large subunit [Pelagerythrobacter marinus]
MAEPRTLFAKLWDQHRVADLPGGAALIAIDRIFLHERTGAAALGGLKAAGRSVADPARVFCVMDHIVDTRPGRDDRTLMPGGQAFITETRAAAREAGLTLFDVTDPDQGIVHVVSPELGIVLPGATLVAPDSHTCTQGALGALAWGIGSSEAEHAMATGTLRVATPRTMRVTYTGKLGRGVTPKDMILALIARHEAGGGKGHVVEFAGEAVTALDMEGRMTLCNMATEFAAMTGVIAPDEATFDYLAGRRYAPRGAAWDRAVAHWRTLATDPGASFDAELEIDAAALEPMVSWGTSPEHSVAISGAVPGDAGDRPLAYMGLRPGEALAGLPIDAAFIGSCTNSRLSDLRRAAALLTGRRVAPGVKALCVPGSSAVKRAAEAEGLDKVFTEAGFEWRESGCSMCFYAGGESFPAGSRVVSSTNRNFEGRQGPGIRTHVASPETVVASAIAGRIADPRAIGEGADA